jgi:uncharacterized protein (TIGR00369 family)
VIVDETRGTGQRRNSQRGSIDDRVLVSAIPEVGQMDTSDHAHQSLDGLLGIEIEEAGPDRCVVKLDIDGRHLQPYGIVHGGIYCVLAESAASIGGAMHAAQSDLNGAVGVSNSTDFYRSMREGTIRAVATPVHRGRSQQVWQVEMRDDQGRLVSRSQVRLHNLANPDAIGGMTR